MKIQEMHAEQRPREKALRYGLCTLSDYELMMLLIGSGYKGRGVDQIASDVLEATDSLKKLYDMRLEDLQKIDGISSTKALQILGGLELAVRALKARSCAGQLRQAEDAAQWFAMEYGTKRQEYVVAVFLDVHLHILRHKVLYIGTLDSSEVHPREVFREAFLENASHLILVHNHPSQDVRPSEGDLEVTSQLLAVAAVMGITFQDHIIVTSNEYFSFRESGLMEELEPLYSI